MSELAERLHVLAREYHQHRPHYEEAAAEIERLTKEAWEAFEANGDLANLVMELRADNERLRAENQDHIEAVCKAAAEVERLNRQAEIWREDFRKGRAEIEQLQASLKMTNGGERQLSAFLKLEADNDHLRASLQLARSMFLDLERGIAPARADFNKIEAALKDTTP